MACRRRRSGTGFLRQSAQRAACHRRGLPEQLVFDGSLKDCIHIFSEQSIEEGSEQINAYLEQGAAEWTENGWEQFTCRTAVLGCCSGFYLSIVNKKDL